MDLSRSPLEGVSLIKALKRASMKLATSWYSDRVQQQTTLVRWGTFGRPVLVFPTAGGDAEEIERMLMIKALSGLLEAGRIKVYSIDSLPTRSWGDGSSSRHSTWLQNQYDAYVYREVLPAIRADCRTPDIEVVVAGASIGAFNALSTVCRHPDAFRRAICLSGSYDIERFIRGSDGMPLHKIDADFYFSSPLHYLPGLQESDQLRMLRKRFILLAHGQGDYEDPGQDWRVAKLLGSKGVPNRVDCWGPDYGHNWPTWRAMLPHYLAEID